jgi:hypothetical protein
MWIMLVDGARTVWVWLPAITVIAKAATAVITLAVTTERAVRWWRAGR